MADLTGKKIAFLLTDGVEQVELTEPRKALDEAGAQTAIVSPAEGTLTAMKGDWDHADTFPVDQPLAEAKAEDYDALVLPGGTINADTLRIQDGATDFLTAFLDADKPVAAICHAPWTLVEANDKRWARVKVLRTINRALEDAFEKSDKKARKHKD